MDSARSQPKSSPTFIFSTWAPTSAGTPKIAGTTHNVFGIQTGVAIGFFVRDRSKAGGCSIHYARREDAELAVDKLAYLREAQLGGIAFDSIGS